MFLLEFFPTYPQVGTEIFIAKIWKERHHDAFLKGARYLEGSPNRGPGRLSDEDSFLRP